MPWTDAAADGLLRAARRAVWLEHAVVIAGWLVAPASLAALALSGELMANGWSLARVPAFATLRGMHVLAGGVLIAVIAYRAARGLWRLYRGRIAREQLWALARRCAESVQPLVRAGSWTCLGLLIVTGLGRYARLRYGYSPLMPGTPAAWDVIHVTAVPYFYGFLMLEAYLRVRRWLPKLREYLVRHY